MDEPGRPSLQGACILVIEDHKDLLEGLSAALRLLGASVLTASDGNAALEITRRTTPQIILCDLRMTGMDGFEFIGRFHSDPSMRRIPVVAMSGLPGEQAFAKTRQAGFAGHLTKPIAFSTLAAQLGRLLLSGCGPTGVAEKPPEIRR